GQGVIPAVLERATGRRAYSLAVCAGSAPAAYFLLRRALAAGARPAAVLVEFHPALLAAPPRSALAYLPDLAGLRDALDLSWATGDPGLFASMLLARALPTAKDRGQIRLLALAALRGEDASLRGYTMATLRQYRINRGARIDARQPGYRGE